MLDISSSILSCHKKRKCDMDRNLLRKNVSYLASTMITIPNMQFSQSGCKIGTMANNDTAPVTSAFDSSAEIENSTECDWSEHVSPDGDFYYYNCVTCESRVRSSFICIFFSLLLNQNSSSDLDVCPLYYISGISLRSMQITKNSVT